MIPKELVFMKCIAVDDEAPALTIIRSHVKSIPWINLEAEFRSAHAALEHIRTNGTDLVFLDINMPDLSGLEMADMLDVKTRIIFTTAHSEFAIRGFEVAAVDYLLKPIGFDRLLKACERARNLKYTESSIIKKPDYLFFKEGYNWIRINLDEVIYLEASDNYVLFHEKQKKSMVRLTMTEVMARISEKGFIRIHKSYGIATKFIGKISSNHVMAGELKIPLSSAYRSALINKLQTLPPI